MFLSESVHTCVCVCVAALLLCVAALLLHCFSVPGLHLEVSGVSMCPIRGYSHFMASVPEIDSRSTRMKLLSE